VLRVQNMLIQLCELPCIENGRGLFDAICTSEDFEGDMPLEVAVDRCMFFCKVQIFPARVHSKLDVKSS
jgi:hypothetical protein